MNVGKPQPCPRPHRDLRRRIERRMTAAFLLSLSLTVAVGAQSGAGLDGAAAASQAARPARILYASDWAFPANQIYVADPAAGKPIGRVTFGPAPACRRWLGNWCGFDAPEPSPDGRKVLIWFRHHTPGAGKDLATAYVSRADGRGRRITVASAVPLSRFDDPLAGWSSDSRRIAYRSEGQWHVVGANGKGARSVPWPTWAPDPGWSPDHRWLVTFGRKEFTLTEARRNVSRTFPIEISETLAWSPDSRRLAVVALDGQGIYIVRYEDTSDPSADSGERSQARLVSRRYVDRIRVPRRRQPDGCGRPPRRRPRWPRAHGRRCRRLPGRRHQRSRVDSAAEGHDLSTSAGSLHRG